MRYERGHERGGLGLGRLPVQGPHKGHTQGGAGATNNQLTNNQQEAKKKRRWPAPSSELRALREGALSPIPQFPISQPRGVSSALAGRATSDEHELLLTRAATSNATLPPFTFTFFLFCLNSLSWSGITFNFIFKRRRPSWDQGCPYLRNSCSSTCSAPR